MMSKDIVDTQQLKEVFILVGYNDICLNENYEGKNYGVYTEEHVAEAYGEQFVKDGLIHHYIIEYFILK